MRAFSSLDAFANHLGRTMVQSMARWTPLNEAAQLVQERAREKIGTFQPAVGPFPAWAEPLAEITQEERVMLGYTPNDPLLREGTLRDSITYEVNHVRDEAVVGSEMWVAHWQELGTPWVPPRPFLGPSLYESWDEIMELIGNGLLRMFFGHHPIYPAAGRAFAMRRLFSGFSRFAF